MRRFFRWQYVLPRLVLMVALFFCLQFGLAWWVRRTVVRSGEQVVGAEVEVGASRVLLLRRQVVLRDLRVANPRSPMSNLITVDSCELSLDGEALLRKQAVVHGTVRGLQFGTPRVTTGKLPGVTPDEELPWADWLHSEAAQLAGDWLQQLDEKFQQDLVDELQSVRLTEELIARWPRQYAALEDRVRELNEQTAQFQARLRQAQANPLRHAAFLERMPDQVALLRTEYQKLSGEVEAMPDLADADRRAIVAARQHDELILREKLHLDKVDQSVLTAYLLQEQLAGPVGNTVGWLRWIRQIIPAEPQPSVPVARRGEEIRFSGCDRSPNLLIRWLDLEGSARIGDQTVELTGSLANVSSDPALHYQPMEIVLNSTGPLPLELRATIDRTSPMPRDEFTVDCAAVTVPKLLLGQSEKLRLSLQPTTASLRIRVFLVGDQLSGDVELVQKQVRITPHVGGDLSRLPIASALDESLSRVDSIATRVTLRGTLDKPQWSLESDLGTFLASATRDAFGQAVAQHAQRVLANSQRTVDEQLTQLDRHIARKQATLLPRLAELIASLDQTAGNGDHGKRLSYEQLGRQLPASSMFR